MEEWTVSYHKPGGIFARLGFSTGDIEIVSLRFHPMSGRASKLCPQRDRVSDEKMQNLEPPIQNIVQRVLQHRQAHMTAFRNDWGLFSLDSRTLVPAPKLYGNSLHECHFVLVKTDESIDRGKELNFIAFLMTSLTF